MEREIRLGSLMGKVLHDVGVNKALFVKGSSLLVPSAMASFLSLGGTARLFDGDVDDVLFFNPHVVVAERADKDLIGFLEVARSKGILPDLFLFEIGEPFAYEGDVYVLFLDEERKTAVLGKVVGGEVEEVFEYEVSCRLFL